MSILQAVNSGLEGGSNPKAQVVCSRGGSQIWMDCWEGDV